MLLNIDNKELQVIIDLLNSNNQTLLANKLSDNKDNQKSSMQNARDTRTQKTMDKIVLAVDELKKENKKINVNSVHKKSNVSINTIKKYKDLLR